MYKRGDKVTMPDGKIAKIAFTFMTSSGQMFHAFNRDYEYRNIHYSEVKNVAKRRKSNGTRSK